MMVLAATRTKLSLIKYTPSLIVAPTHLPVGLVDDTVALYVVPVSLVVISSPAVKALEVLLVPESRYLTNNVGRSVSVDVSALNTLALTPDV